MGKARGEAVADPNPTVYVTNDPLRKALELAVVLGRYWALPEDLLSARPRSPALILPDGAVA